MDISRKTSVIASTAVLVAAGGAAAAVSASGAEGQAAGQGFAVLQTGTAIAFVDAPPKGGISKPFTRGDAFVISGRLGSGGKRIGHDDLVCTTTRPGRRGGQVCTGSITLSAGQLTFTGYNTVADKPVTRYAVTGGTGAYAGASGTLETREQKRAELITYKP